MRVLVVGAGLMGAQIGCEYALGAHDVTLTARRPDRIEGRVEEAFEVAMQEVPLRRMSEPEEIAGTVAWLLSPEATGVTGQGIDHNNGAWMI